MLLSMTGFGKASAELPARKITVEVKSLNSKQLDVNLRLPGIYRHKEPDLRARVAALLERGKVDLSIYTESTAADSSQHLNLALLADYKRQIQQMAETLGIPEPQDWYSVLLRMPDILHNDPSETVDPDEAATLLDTLEDALKALLTYRRAEGEKLEDFFRLRIQRISDLLDQVEPYEAERITRIRTRITENLSRLPVTAYDDGRLEQEMIYYIEKLDVNEEKQRLRQHLSYFIKTMDAPRPGQGKQLGFIAQEMGREINTLGSKSNHAEMQRLVVMMKDELEQIKEQVLNVM